MPAFRAHLAHAACAATLVVALLALPGTASAAGTLHVDAASTAPLAGCGTEASPCRTLTDAFSRATGGEIIEVAPGTYAGAQTTKRVHLRGAHAGMSARARGVDAPGASIIRGTLTVLADVSVDGFQFDGPPVNSTLILAAPAPGQGSGASLLTNNVFAGGGGAMLVYATAASTGHTFSGNLFVARHATTRVAIFAHGEQTSDGIQNLLVEGNEFRGFGGHEEAAVIDAGGTPGLRVRENTVLDSGPLVVLSDVAGDGVRIHDNVGSDFTGPALHLGLGIRGVTVERNRLAGGSGAAIRIADERGTGRSSGIVVRANNVSGIASAIVAEGDSLDGSVEAHGNRFVTTGATAISNASTAGTIDARRNWWGRSAGLAAGATNGSVDVGEPLRLVGVEAPAALFVGGTGVVAIRMVGAAGSGSAPEAAGFPVTFATSSGTLDATTVTVAFGAASTLLTAGSTPGTTTTTATLDGEHVSATTQVVARGSEAPTGLANPSVAEGPRPTVTGDRGFAAFVEHRPRLLRFSLSRGLRQYVQTNRRASVRTTWIISPATARRLGLRTRTSRSRKPFVVATVRTRAIRGQRIVTARIRVRPRFAIARYRGRVQVLAVTHVRSVGGGHQRFRQLTALPVDVR